MGGTQHSELNLVPLADLNAKISCRPRSMPASVPNLVSSSSSQAPFVFLDGL